MSSQTNIPINSRSMNGIIVISDGGGTTIEDGVVTTNNLFAPNVATLNENETISGIYTFTPNLPQSSVIPTLAAQLVNKTYVDGLDTNNVKISGSQTLTTGVKTFTNLPECSTAPTTANQLTNKTYVDGLDAQNVKLSGTQTLTTGIKTFTNLPECSTAPTTANQLTNKTFVDGLDAQNVKLSGAQTIAGIKTFSSLPECSVVPTTANQLINKTYADALITSGVVTIAGTQTLTTGIKTFTNLPQSTAVPSVGADLTNKTYVDGLDSNNVKLTGNQSISGEKSFIDVIKNYRGMDLYNQFTTSSIQWVDYVSGAAMGIIYCSKNKFAMVFDLQSWFFNGLNFNLGSTTLMNMAIDGIFSIYRGLITDNITNNHAYISPSLKSIESSGSTLTSNTSDGNNVSSGNPVVLSSAILSSTISNNVPVWTCVAPIGFNGNLNFKTAVLFGSYNATIVNCFSSMSSTITQVISHMRLRIYRDGIVYRNIPIPILGGNSETTQYSLTTPAKVGTFLFNQFIGDYEISVPVLGDSSVSYTYTFEMLYDLQVSWVNSTSGIDGDFDLFFNTTISTHSLSKTPVGAVFNFLNPDGAGYAVSALTTPALTLTTTGTTYTNALKANTLNVGSNVYCDGSTLSFNYPTNDNAINSTGTTLKLYANSVNSVSVIPLGIKVNVRPPQWIMTGSAGGNGITTAGNVIGAMNTQIGSGFNQINYFGNASSLGSGWTTSTGVFTAPTDGMYQFQLNIFNNSGSISGRSIVLSSPGVLGGQQYCFFNIQPTGGDYSYNWTQMVWLSSGQVSSFFNQSGANLTLYYAAVHTTLSIIRIY